MTRTGQGAVGMALGSASTRRAGMPSNRTPSQRPLKRFLSQSRIPCISKVSTVAYWVKPLPTMLAS